MNDLADKLKILRKTLGLTQREMGDKIGVSSYAIAHCERRMLLGTTSPNQAKISSFIDASGVEFTDYDEFSRQNLINSIRHHFKQGHCYRIFSSSTTSISGGKAPKLASAGISWEKQCVFVFLRKEGKHHVFREVNGGWTRTYTDPQLIGKKIIEVAHEG